jgi:hypothetical protein
MPARSANGAATLLPIPAIVGHAATRLALEKDPTIATVLALERRAPVICFGIGALAPDSVLVQSGFITIDEQAALKARGAVGDILSRYVGVPATSSIHSSTQERSGWNYAIAPSGNSRSAWRLARISTWSCVPRSRLDISTYS